MFDWLGRKAASGPQPAGSFPGRFPAMLLGVADGEAHTRLCSGHAAAWHSREQKCTL